MGFPLAAARRRLLDPNLSPDDKTWIEEKLREADRLFERDPLQSFEPHSPAQKEFLEARTPIQAAFCGNQFGKTCALIVKCYAQHLPSEALSGVCRPYKLTKGGPVDGYLLIPSFKLLETVYLPELRKWAPREHLHKQSFDSAWDKTQRTLRFQNGGALHVFTYEQDADKMVGARLDYVAYDEPPPQPIREECSMRLAARGGFEMFAMTPVNISGGGIGWIHNEIWLKREDPQITVVKGSIHDNPTLDKDTVERTLARYTDERRRAREFGDFVHIGGVVFPGGFEQYLMDPPDAETVSKWDTVVGIDPGIKNTAIIWVGFDGDNTAYLYDEVLLQEQLADVYVKAIRATNRKWGIKEPLYVIDPNATARGPVNGQNVESVLQSLGIYPMHAYNRVEAGVMQMQLRLQRKRLHVSRECRGIRGEADVYRMKDRPDGEFEVVKENDHRLDAARYAVTTRLWDPAVELSAPREQLGYKPGVAPSLKDLESMYVPPSHPLGTMA